MLLQTMMKQGGTLMPLVLPKIEGLLVVAVERFQGRLQLAAECSADRALRLCRGPSWASCCGCSPRGCGTSASRRRECFPRPGLAAALRCRTRSHPSARSRSSSMGTACLRRSPEPRRKNGVADKSMTRLTPSFRLTISRPEIQMRAASLFFSASFFSSPFRLSSSAASGFSR